MSVEPVLFPASPSTILRHAAGDSAPPAPPKAGAAEPAAAGAREATGETRPRAGPPQLTVKMPPVTGEDGHGHSLSGELAESKAQRRCATANFTDRTLPDGTGHYLMTSPSSSVLSGAGRRHTRGGRIECPPVMGRSSASYVSLLPASLELRKLQGSRSSIVVGVAASEMFAAREVRRSTGVTNSVRAKTKLVSPLEMCGFEKKMKHFQDCAKLNRRLWRRHSPSVTKSVNKGILSNGPGSNFNMRGDTTKFYETVITCSEAEGEKRSESSSDESTDECDAQHGSFKVSQAHAVAVARRDYVNLASRAQKCDRATTLLRASLKESAQEVAHARHGHTLARKPLVLPITQYNESGMEMGSLGEGKLTGGGRKTDTESISWGTESTKEDISEEQKQEREQEQDEDKTSSQNNALQDGDVNYLEETSPFSSDTVPGRSVTSDLRILLNRGKKTMVYGLSSQYNTRRRKSSSSLSLPPISSLEQGASTDAPTGTKHSFSTLHRRACASQKHQPLPVEIGVGERSRCVLDSLIVRQRTDEIEYELQRADDVRRTRELMRKLMPERERLLDESLAQPYVNPTTVMDNHRRCVYRTAAEMDTRERQRECIAYIDTLEQRCGKEVVESAWPAVAKTLQQARTMFMHNSSRCNARTFLGIVKECFEVSQLTEPSVRDILKRLSLLFDMSSEDYDGAIDITCKRMNNPKTYEARFREVDRTVVGRADEGDIKVRVVLHRCRFLPLPETGNDVGPESMGYEPEIAVRLRTEQNAVTSEGTRVKSCRRSSSLNENIERESRLISNAMSGVANLRGQALRLHMTERLSVDVELLMDGKSIGAGELRLSDVMPSPRGSATFWMRTAGETCPLAEVKMTLETFHDKEKRRKSFGKGML